MNYHERYKLRFKNNKNIPQSRKNNTKNLIQNLFYNSSNYTKVKINDIEKDCLLVKGKNYTDKQLQFLPEEDIIIGSYVNILDDIWIITDSNKDVNNLFPVAKIEKCNTTLKWIDDSGFIQEYPCVFYFNTKSNFGVSSDRVMVIPDGRRQVVVQANKDTLNIKHNMRFIFNNRAWKIIDYDFVDYEGLVTLSLEEDTINKSLDNIEERLANHDRLAQYSIEILNKDFHLKQGETLQLDVIVKSNDTSLPYSPQDITFKSSDETIVIVDEYGLITAIGNGQCEITVIFKEKEDLFATCIVEVTDNLIEDYLEIIGRDTIPYYSEETFSAAVYSGGKKITSGVKWLVQDDKNLVRIVSQNPNSIRLRAGNKKGSFKLIATLLGNDSILEEKEIDISGLF